MIGGAPTQKQEPGKGSVMAISRELLLERRKFLKGVAIAGAGTLLTSTSGPSVQAQGPTTTTPKTAGSNSSDDLETITTDHPGADFLVDVIKSIGFEYVCAVPGSSYRGLYESIVNYGGNENPEFILCCHEESSVAMCHGYSKMEGKPMCVGIHGTVGLQHASMAIYNAYCDRVPVYIVMGNVMDSTVRRPLLDSYHSAQDPAAMVRDFVKWDDQPMALQGFAESAVRAYKIAMTPPMMPVILVADYAIQEPPIPQGARLRIPKLTVPEPPQGDSGGVAETARLLINAENPVIVVDRGARTQRGIDHLVELAEILQAPVIDQLGRMNFPSRHPLNQSQRSSELIAGADVVLGLELEDYWGTVNSVYRQALSIFAPPRKGFYEAYQH